MVLVTSSKFARVKFRTSTRFRKTRYMYVSLILSSWGLGTQGDWSYEFFGQTLPRIPYEKYKFVEYFYLNFSSFSPAISLFSLLCSNGESKF